MAHRFYIGKPVAKHVQYPSSEPQIRPKVEPVETPPGEDPVHTDPYEIESDSGTGERAPSFRTWEEVLNELPAFRHLWLRLRMYADDHYEPAYIPVEVYLPRLDRAEDEAHSIIENADEDADPGVDGDLTPHAYRALWFTRWSRYAYEQYGEMAAFQSSEPIALNGRSNPFSGYNHYFR